MPTRGRHHQLQPLLRDFGLRNGPLGVPEVLMDLLKDFQNYQMCYFTSYFQKRIGFNMWFRFKIAYWWFSPPKSWCTYQLHLSIAMVRSKSFDKSVRSLWGCRQIHPSYWTQEFHMGWWNPGPWDQTYTVLPALLAVAPSTSIKYGPLHILLPPQTSAFGRITVSLLIRPEVNPASMFGKEGVGCRIAVVLEAFSGCLNISFWF